MIYEVILFDRVCRCVEVRLKVVDEDRTAREEMQMQVESDGFQMWDEERI